MRASWWLNRFSPVAEAKERVLNTYFYAKATPWRYERGWRDLRDTNGIAPHEFRVTAIRFGLRCDPAVVQSVVKLLASDRDVVLYNIYPLNDSFRLKRCRADRDVIESYGLRTPAAIEFKDSFLPGSDE